MKRCGDEEVGEFAAGGDFGGDSAAVRGGGGAAVVAKAAMGNLETSNCSQAEPNTIPRFSLLKEMMVMALTKTIRAQVARTLP